MERYNALNEANELHDGHRFRQRERILAEGLDTMEEHEILEYLISLALPRQDVNELAHSLLDEFGSLKRVLNAELPELSRVNGVGRGLAMWIALMGEAVICAHMHLDDAEISVRLNCLYDILKDLDDWMRKYPAPCTVQVCLDAVGEVLYERIITPSRMWASPEVLREAAGDVMSTGANGVLLLQFVGKLHPSPGQYDLDHLDDYAFTLHAMGSSLLDMIFIGYGGVTSLRQEDKIPDYKLKEAANFLREDYVIALREDRAQDLLHRLKPDLQNEIEGE